MPAAIDILKYFLILILRSKSKPNKLVEVFFSPFWTPVRCGPSPHLNPGL